MERILAAALREADKIKQERNYWRQRALAAEKERGEWMDLCMNGEVVRNQMIIAFIMGEI